MKLSGTLSKDNFDHLKEEVEAAKKLVKETSQSKKGMIKSLFDLTDFTGVYNVGAMMLMKELADHNRPYISKTGIFGGNDLARVAAQITVTMIQDPTIKMFNTKDQAILWLKS